MVTNPNVKINLGLNVLRKRSDGYHDLDTLFVPYMGIHDTLEVIMADDFSRTSAGLFARYDSSKIVQGISEDGKLMITIAKSDGVDWDPLKDLCAKAYYLLDADFNLPSVKIFLEKTSPVGAGLGGGSSDAAFCLKMLSDLCGLGLDEPQLASYAARLGSDCAFFIFNRPMFGTGRGEVLEDYPLPVLDDYRLEVVVPEGISVSTADAYRGIVPAEPEIPLKEALRSDISCWKELVRNDFETTVFEKYPGIAAVKKSLYDLGAIYASMSGSGSALYAIFKK